MTTAPQQPSRTVAMITNVGMALEALDRSITRAPTLPGMVVFSGPSGYGKTIAACYAAISTKAHYVAVKSTMTRKSLLKAILLSLGGATIGTIDDLRERVEEMLQRSGRPLILDEADYLLDRNMMSVVRDIHDATGTAIMLIGEEQIGAKLRKIERLHNRVLCWAQAQPATAADARLLATLYAPRTAIADDLLQLIHEASRGVVRRICINIDRVRDTAAKEGWSKATRALWGDRPLYTGEAPPQRVFS